MYLSKSRHRVEYTRYRPITYVKQGRAFIWISVDKPRLSRYYDVRSVFLARPRLGEANLGIWCES